jgi:hypothetical protein
MTELQPRMDMRPKLTEVKLPVDVVKELSEVIPKPEDQFNYTLAGKPLPNQDKYQVVEEGAISDYTFPDKSDMSKVQLVSRKTYIKEVSMWGTMKEKPVKFDKQSGKWKKLSLFENIKAQFHKADHIPAQVVDGVLHTMEAKRPVGKNVKEAQLGTLDDVKVEIGLRYKFLDNQMQELIKTNTDLEEKIAYKDATIRGLNARILASNIQSYEPLTNTNSYWETRTQTRSEEPPTYGNITPSGDTPKKSNTPDRTPPKKNEKLDRRGDEVIGKFEKNMELRTKTAKEVREWLAKEKTSLLIDQKTGMPRKDMAELVEQSLGIGSIFYSAKPEHAASKKYTVETRSVHVQGEMENSLAVVFVVRGDCKANDLLSNQAFLRDLFLVEQSIPEDKQLFSYQLSKVVDKDLDFGVFPKL